MEVEVRHRTWGRVLPSPLRVIKYCLLFPSLIFQLIIASYTLYTFTAGALFAVIWCLTAFGLCLRIQVPNASLFPEIDIASKAVADDSTGLAGDRLGVPR